MSEPTLTGLLWSPSFFAELCSFLIGDLARFQYGLVGPDDSRPDVRAEDLLDDATMTMIIERFNAKFGQTDPRAIMSMWASIYFTDVIPPLLTANIMLDLAPMLGLSQVSFIMSKSLRIEALKIPRDLVSLADAGAAIRFDSLVSAHLVPFIELVARRAHVTRRVLWSNAGNVFEAFTLKLKAVTGDRPGFQHARELLTMPTLCGRRNPLFEPVRYVEGRRIRRVCCMRYLIPNQNVCGVCPLPADSSVRRSNAGLPR
jgi:ferric iron reductase protein FhuF